MSNEQPPNRPASTPPAPAASAPASGAAAAATSPAASADSLPPHATGSEAPTRGAYSKRIRSSKPDLIERIPLPGEGPAGGPELSRRQRNRLKTFERLVVEARQILFDRDLKDVAVQDITDAADTGKGTFFNYFASKEQVVLGMLLFVRRSLAETVMAVERDGVDFKTAIQNWLVSYFCPESGDWLTYEQNLMQSLLDDEVRADFSPRILDNRQYYFKLLELGQAQGAVRTDIPAEALGLLLHRMVIGLTVMFWMRGTQPTPEAMMAAAEVLIQLVQPPVPPKAASPQPSQTTRKKTTKPPASRRKPASSKSKSKSRRR